MARGWESKAIESQQEDARARNASGGQDEPIQGRATDRTRTLELARAALAAQLERAPGGPLHDSLRQALVDLDRQLDEARRQVSH